MQESKKDDFHDVANMMRAELGVNPHKHSIERQPTAEEYEQAYSIIEQLKEAAKNEPTYKKVSMAILRVVSLPVLSLLSGIDGVAAGNSSSQSRMVETQHQQRIHQFDDAAKKLRQMQKLGKKFSEVELDTHLNIPEAE